MCRWHQVVMAAALLLSAAAPLQAAERVLVAAAADLKYAMDEMIALYGEIDPDAELMPTYGSSGKLQTQIRNGAPFDLFFSADMSYARELVELDLTVGDARPYAIGFLVLWSMGADAGELQLTDLAEARFRRIAIANPRHAPYGQRAEEALRRVGVWDRIEPRLVYGENIAHTAQFVSSGNAQAGIIALSLALNPELSRIGGYTAIDPALHTPLEQAFVVLRRAADKPAALRFADWVGSEPAREILARYGFVLPTRTE